MQVKKRNWAFVVYPESLPDNWREELTLSGLPFAISPLHGNDLNATGEIKKEHYHIIICYNNPSSYDNVKRFTDKFNSPFPIPLENVKGMFRYFTHKDNPEKYQYNDSDIVVGNGFDIGACLNNFDVKQALRQIQILILENNITEYSDLMDLLISSDSFNELWFVASSHTIFINSYISSKRNIKRS